ncbi:hypothetical protein, partial [Klebsiella variicola]|uniref:hypothetical protein n=1 Tax=Klebsiella variicola TaxID=244366 RepID=UPI00273123F3
SVTSSPLGAALDPATAAIPAGHRTYGDRTVEDKILFFIEEAGLDVDLFGCFQRKAVDAHRAGIALQQPNSAVKRCIATSVAPESAPLP